MGTYLNSNTSGRACCTKQKLLLALGLVGGLVLGSGTALLIDLRKDLIYSEDELRRLLPCPLIKHLPVYAQESWSVAADLIAAGPLSELSGSNPVGLIPLGNVPNEQLQAFSTELNRALNGRELIVSNDLRQTSRCFTQLLITSPGVATRAQLSQIIQKLALQGTPLAGWVLLETNQISGEYQNSLLSPDTKNSLMSSILAVLQTSFCFINLRLKLSGNLTPIPTKIPRPFTGNLSMNQEYKILLT